MERFDEMRTRLPPSIEHGTPEWLGDGDEDESEEIKAKRKDLLDWAHRIDAPPPRTNKKAEPAIRLGVVCMTKKPIHLDSWLSHHANALGVVRFYLRVEDTPELAALLDQPPWSKLVRARFIKKPTARDYGGQTQRQVTFVDDAIEWARADNLTHLLHCDDDELLYAPNGLEALQAVLRNLPPTIFNVHAYTLEALVPRAECDNPFAECVAFKHKPLEYSSYGSASHNAGKSMGVLKSKRLRCQGPHHFMTKGAGYNNRFGEANEEVPKEDLFDWTGTHVLPPCIAVILHYESCTIDRWQLKFIGYAERLREHNNGGDDGARMVKQGFTYRFYCESLGACRRLLAARESERPGVVAAAEKYCKEMWVRWKLQPDLSQMMPRSGAVHRVDVESGVTVLARPVVAAGDDEEALTVDDILDLYETPPPSPLLPRIVRLRAGNATSECFRVRVQCG